jgi:hypothetical protein
MRISKPYSLYRPRSSGGRSSRHREGKRSHEKSTDWSWKKIPTGKGEPKTKKFKGRIYYWCTNHKLWCLHKPSECKLKAESQAPSKKPGSGKPKNKQDKYNLKMRAYQTLFESSSEEEIEEEQESSGGNETESSNTSE